MDRLEGMFADFPVLGRELEVRSGFSVRVIRLGRLPYLMWYVSGADRPKDPIHLTFFAHERQRRETPRSLGG